MNTILDFLNMTLFDFIGNMIFLTGLIVCGVYYYIHKDKTKTDRPKKNRAEITSEISRRKQEDDELTAIMREANSDELYSD